MNGGVPEGSPGRNCGRKVAPHNVHSRRRGAVNSAYILGGSQACLGQCEWGFYRAAGDDQADGCTLAAISPSPGLKESGDGTPTSAIYAVRRLRNMWACRVARLPRRGRLSRDYLQEKGILSCCVVRCCARAAFGLLGCRYPCAGGLAGPRSADRDSIGVPRSSGDESR
ncbi:hypothetical protein HYPSUDRAFT_677264 [Hypholoma sublateritium FD-334 SS-4]|uniref:Uncharacterized protein n=1 Tax=Hypholoma sublateritium (strain FD-334 SS-4) TaxID=945553 RepID=A0A0D2L4Z2_HYPSF|nr:hypothetical protein HYPSUDRAFT_677264 [Hypholoma sublateritium FD-334 SS-4]